MWIGFNAVCVCDMHVWVCVHPAAAVFKPGEWLTGRLSRNILPVSPLASHREKRPVDVGLEIP